MAALKDKSSKSFKLDINARNFQVNFVCHERHLNSSVCIDFVACVSRTINQKT